MTIAAWRSHLSGVIHRNRSLVYSRYLQLATVREDGRPANRTVVFRGFLEATNSLKFVTDHRSQKVEQIAHNPWAEACWYFPKTREQFRLLGQLILVQADCSDSTLSNARQIAWQELSETARSQFYWPQPGETRGNPVEFEAPELSDRQPPNTFDLLILDPERVDHLELRGQPQNRHLYWRDQQGSWVTQAVNP